jgi:hypothetical protein
MPAVCDSTQAAPDPSETGPQLPVLPVSDKHAALIGTVEEAVSRHPLNSATIDLTPIDSTHLILSRPRGPTDRLGGFVVDSVAPGEYVVMARRIGYQPSERRISLQVGRVDTVMFSLRRFSCIGY